MASAPTHIVATAAIAAFFHRPRVPWHVWLAGAVLAVAPDLDAIGLRYGVKYAVLLGDRGLTHSLLTAAVISGLVVVLFYRDGAYPLRAKGVWLFLFLAMASHGVLDALTKGGLGVAFFSPFSEKRYFFPERPLAVSPLSIRQFLTSRGLAILLNEMRWVWAPSIGLAATVSAPPSRHRQTASHGKASTCAAPAAPAPATRTATAPAAPAVRTAAAGVAAAPGALAGAAGRRDPPPEPRPAPPAARSRHRCRRGGRCGRHFRRSATGPPPDAYRRRAGSGAGRAAAAQTVAGRGRGIL